MDKNKQKIIIAEACGWTKRPYGDMIVWYDPKGCAHPIGRGNRNNCLPDYLNDLNAINEAKKFLKGKQKSKFAEHLCDILKIDDDYYVPRPEHNDRIYHGNSRAMFDIASATAGQQSEAFIRTIGKWEN